MFAAFLKDFEEQLKKMSEEEEIVPKSRQANAAIAPRRFQQVFLFFHQNGKFNFYRFSAQRWFENRKKNF